MVRLGLVVEGHGEQAALPVLVRRILVHRARYDVEIGSPVRLPQTKMLNADAVARAVALAAVQADAVLIVLDSDDDCPASTAPQLLVEAQAHARGLPVAVVMAHREYEAWLLASLTSLASSARVLDGAAFEGDVEARRDAKGLLRRFMVSGTYSETLDQVKLSSLVDVDVARSASPSFDKLCRDLAVLVP